MQQTYFAPYLDGADTQSTLVPQPTRRQTFTRFFETVTGILRDAHIPHFVVAGTLLGAARHAAFIPWDDDIDVAIPEAEKARILAMPRWNDHGLQVIAYPTTPFLKVFYKGRPHVSPEEPYSEPWMDLFPYREEAGRVRVQLGWQQDQRLVDAPRDDVFPLTSLPLEHLWVPAPRRWDRILHRQYGALWRTECVGTRMHHRVLSPSQPRSMKLPCAFVSPGHKQSRR